MFDGLLLAYPRVVITSSVTLLWVVVDCGMCSKRVVKVTLSVFAVVVVVVVVVGFGSSAESSKYNSILDVVVVDGVVVENCGTSTSWTSSGRSYSKHKIGALNP